MIQKLTTTHMVLIGLALVAIGFAIGKYWDTWFPKTVGAERKAACPPGEVMGFNSLTGKSECHPYSSGK